jgi:hypothetical protein
MINVQEICNELLPNLDEDIFDYIVSALEEFQNDGSGLNGDGIDDVDTQTETADMISNFLESAGYIEDSDVATAKAKELVQKIVSDARPPPKKVTHATKTRNSGSVGGTGVGRGTTSIRNDIPQKLSDETKKITLQLKETSLLASPVGGVGGTNESSGIRTNMNTMLEDGRPTTEKEMKQVKKREDKSSKRQEKHKKYGKFTAAEIAEQEAMAIEEELTNARIAAVKARTKLGAYKGALDAQAFTLPNPGGGQPLLEDASCRLVWGRRYALIGRNGMVS